jgi:hypothetical protein
MSDLPPNPGADWPAQAADTIVRVVGQVRNKTTGPAVTVARGVVYGVLAGITGIVFLVLLAICLVRVIDVYLPESVTSDDNTWLAHAIVGAVFTGAGLVLWRFRRTTADEPM